MATTSNLSFLPLPSNIVSDSRAFLLQRRMEEIIPSKQNELKTVLKEYGDIPLQGGPVTVSQAIGGARDVQCIYWETSLLDSIEGIRMRGFTIPELQQFLPKASTMYSSNNSPITSSSGSSSSINSNTVAMVTSSSPSSSPSSSSTMEQPLPEALLWLLLTGEIPTPAQTSSISRDLASRSLLSSYVIQTVRNFPPNMHPMTQLIAGVLAMQPHSIFAAAYASGAPKNNLWRAALEDTLNLIAKLPTLAALIYRHTYFNDNSVIGDKFHPQTNSTLPTVLSSSSSSTSFTTPLPTVTQPLDYAANFARMMGFNHPELDEALRLYFVLHADHEGGNVSAHSTRLVGSSLADPYLAFSAALAGLAGPLHGRANQEVMQWILDLKADFEAKKKPITKETIAAYTWDTLRAGRVIPGYGHAVLRKTDPRYTAQREFCLQFMPTDPLFHIVSTVFEVVPQVLKEHGKTRNPWPNVDAHSGVLLTHYGLSQHTFYTVLFGISRAFGVLSQLVWDRALNLPLERPKSVNLQEMYRQIQRYKEQQEEKEQTNTNRKRKEGNDGLLRPKL